MKLAGYRRKKIAPGIEIHERQPAGRHTQSHYDTDQPWICWHFGLSHDLWWPPWNSTRWTGRMKVVMECAICGNQTTLKLKIPRTGPVDRPDKHPARLRYMLTHLHKDQQHPMSWAKPLLNPAAHQGGINLELLAMRLEADLRDSKQGGRE